MHTDSSSRNDFHANTWPYILERLENAVLIVNDDGDCLYANAAGQVLLQEESKNFLQGQRGDVTRVRTADNRWFQRKVNPVSWEGDLLRLITYQDITEQVQADQFIQLQKDVHCQVQNLRVEKAYQNLFSFAAKLFPFQSAWIFSIESHSNSVKTAFTHQVDTREISERFEKDADSLSRFLNLEQTTTGMFHDFFPLEDENMSNQAMLVFPFRDYQGISHFACFLSRTRDEVPAFSQSIMDSCKDLFEWISVDFQKTKYVKQVQNELNGVIESINQLVFILSQSGKILHCNQIALQQMDYTLEEFGGRHFSEWLAPEYSEGPRNLDELLDGGIPQADLTILAKDGLRIPLDARISGVTWHGKKACLLMGRDIQASRQSEKALRKVNEQLNHVLSSVSDFLWSGEAFDPGHIEVNFASPVFERLSGFAVEDLVKGQITWFEVIHNEDKEEVLHAFQKRFNGMESNEIEYRIIHKNGEIFWVRDSLSIRKISRHRYGLDGVITDITARKRMEESLQQSYENLTDYVKQLRLQTSETTIINEMGDMLQSCDHVNDTYRILKQFIGELFPGMSGALYMLEPNLDLLESVITWGLMPPEEMVFDLDECWGLRRSNIQIYTQEDAQVPCSHVHEAGDMPYTCIPLIAQSKILGLLHLRGQTDKNMRDYTQVMLMITERLAMAIHNLKLGERLKSQSIRDQLTGLFNRRYLEEMMQREIRRAARYERTVGIIMLDIDHFKGFNDTYGHAAGDIVLHAIGNYLQEHMRGEDIVSRYGGEEFTIILAEASLEDTVLRAETLRKGINNINVKHAGKDLGQISVSIGVACFPIHGKSADVLMHAADLAMYEAKRKGRNCVVTADEDKA